MKPQRQSAVKWAAIAAGMAMVMSMIVTTAATAGDDQARERGPDKGAFAEHGRGEGFRGEGFMARAEAACEGKAVGAAVTLTGPDEQTIDAICSQRPARLIAVPKVQLERLAQATAACNGLSEGAAAVLTTKDGRTLAAQCHKRDGTLIAVPNERPRMR